VHGASPSISHCGTLEKSEGYVGSLDRTRSGSNLGEYFATRHNHFLTGTPLRFQRRGWELGGNGRSVTFHVLRFARNGDKQNK
jgi:hypothetical protein